MELVEIILTSIGLGMDAFSVSICKGLALKKCSFKSCFVIGIYFGLFQGLMPLIGYFLANKFVNIISNIDHYVIFILLGFIGFNMIKEGLSKEGLSVNNSTSFKDMFFLAIATSIDALAVGITCAFLDINIIKMVLMIAIITFIMSFIGVKIGNIVGSKFEKNAQIVGGCILIFIGIKILIEHLFF